jgi:tryptophan-rich sensory protein
MIFQNALDVILFLLPILSGFVMSAICPVSSTSGDKVPFRPPSWVFGVVWFILYILLGLSWVIARHQDNGVVADVYYSLLTASLVLWIVMYSCLNQKKNAIYVFGLSFICVISALCLGNLTSKLMIVPLLVWLIYAFSLNTFEVSV